MTHLGDLFSAYLDGETTVEEAHRVVTHLESCDVCQSELGDLHSARSALRALPTLELPAGFLEDLGARERVVPFRRNPRRIAAAAVAAALVLFVAVATLLAPEPTALSFDEITNQPRAPISPVLTPTPDPGGGG